MATALSLSGPVGYMGGSAQNSGPFVGYGSSKNYVLRYSFKTPSDGYVTKVTFKTTFRHYSSSNYSIGSSYPIRVKITDSSTSHKNAGSGSSYDVTMTGNGSVTISGLKLQPNTTYYIYLFPGHTSYSLSYCYDNEGNDYASATYEASSLGQVYIGNGTGFDAYEVYIGHGSGWDRYIRYVGNGSGWAQCS